MVLAPIDPINDDLVTENNLFSQADRAMQFDLVGSVVIVIDDGVVVVLSNVIKVEMNLPVINNVIRNN